ncbi:transcriptional regulator [Thiohalophilus sp.]|uniref:helix-turn-helix domain-containing protein n=1 Tax=Thiohalophilus sp. TaxID=3028392 RepID=UPI002ACE08F2|nr:transcriptional regulator [Thiohalophilus sp.]MDZ7661656.1 transcriptional regulator [Thiohalophilus sp.]
MDIAVIKNPAQYEEAIQTLETLMDRDPKAGTDEANQLELLGLLLEDYENKHTDIGLPDPVDAIKFRMEQQGLKQKDLVPYIGSATRVSEILARKRPLTLRMIRALNRGLGIPAEVLIQEPGEEIPQESGIDYAQNRP